MMPYKDITSSKRGRGDPIVAEEVLMLSRTVAVPTRSPIEWLEYGLKSRTHEKPGWLKDKLLRYGLMEATSEAREQLLLIRVNTNTKGIKEMVGNLSA